jgi:hypothetical protein
VTCDVHHVTCGCRSTLALLAATASLCKGGANPGVFTAAAAAADRDNEAAASCYAGLLHVTALLNKGCLPEAEIQASVVVVVVMVVKVMAMTTKAHRLPVLLSLAVHVPVTRHAMCSVTRLSTSHTGSNSR